MNLLMRIVRYLHKNNPEGFSEALKEVPGAREIIISEGGARLVIESESKDVDLEKPCA